MKTRAFKILALFGAVLAVLQFSSCILIRPAVGGGPNASSSGTVIPGWKVQSLSPGDKLVVFLKNGSQQEGKFKGLALLPESQYAEQYNKVREELGSTVRLPELGERVTMMASYGRLYKLEFLGFDFGKIAVKMPGQEVISTPAWESIQEIKDHQGVPFDLPKMKELAAENKLPFLSSLTLRVSGKDGLIPINDISQVLVKKGNDVLIDFLIAGAVVGAVIAVVMIASAEPESPSPGPTQSIDQSCPHVYSFDGRDFVLDSETFSAAFFKAAQRTDWDNLDHLRAVDGRYLLKIKNSYGEIQHIDEIALLAVDHPLGTKVVPSFSGKLHVIAQPESPMKAIDSKGNDILELVKEKDKLSWVSNPFGRNLEREEQVRDGMLLEFSRPQDRGFARLVFSVRNTAWASYMEGHLSRLHGKNLAQWREWMNSSAAAREGFRKALEREVMFSLKLWTGQSWKDVDHIWSVGPACPKDVAVELDIRDIPGPTLRLKLESTAGLWTVDCAKADFTPAQPIAVTEAHPIQAKDNKDGDISGLLKNIDGLDYVLTSDEDWAELSFRAPAPKKGYDRSLILKSTGYYLVPGSPEAEPEKAAAGMMMKPGAFGKYSLELLSGYMKAALARMERN